MAASRPLIVGLTGSIGMGKSETAKMFAALGIPVFSADEAVHRLYEPGGAAVAAIAEAFPGCVREGRVDREALARHVNAGEREFRRLEEIVHPLVAREQREFLRDAESQSADLVVLDIPLLLETGGHGRLDAIVVATAPPDVQRARVLARPGMSGDRLERLLARQMPDAEKRAKAHFVVETDRGLEHARRQVEAIVATLRARRAARKERGGDA